LRNFLRVAEANTAKKWQRIAAKISREVSSGVARLASKVLTDRSVKNFYKLAGIWADYGTRIRIIIVNGPFGTLDKALGFGDETMISEIKHEVDKGQRADFERAALPLMNYLFAKAMKLTGNQNDAEDLVQDTYTMGLRKWHLYQPETNLKAWLARLQFNLFISQYRRRKKRPDGASIAGMEELVRDRPHYDTRPDLLDLEPQQMLNDGTFVETLPAELRAGLNEMDRRYRDVLLLNVVGEKSYKDIAATLSVPVGTVMSRLSRAKSFLRDYFAALGLTPAQS
jgi:RNA polymerase sigma-70 factor (ECF subfamily)